MATGASRPEHQLTARPDLALDERRSLSDWSTIRMSILSPFAHNSDTVSNCKPERTGDLKLIID